MKCLQKFHSHTGLGSVLWKNKNTKQNKKPHETPEIQTHVGLLSVCAHPSGVNALVTDPLEHWFSNFSMPPKPWGDLRKHRPLGPNPQCLWFKRSGQGLRICISTTVPVMLVLLVQGPHFENHNCREFGESSNTLSSGRCDVDSGSLRIIKLWQAGLRALMSILVLEEICDNELLSDLKLVWWIL